MNIFPINPGYFHIGALKVLFLLLHLYSLELHSEQSQDRYIDSLFNRVSFYHNLYQLDKEYEVLTVLDSLGEELEDERLLFDIAYAKSEISRAAKRYQNSLEVLDKMIDEFGSYNLYYYVETKSQMASVLFELTYIDTVRKICGELIDTINNNSEYESQWANLHVILGATYNDTYPDSALIFHEKALSTYRKLGYPSKIGQVLVNEMWCYELLENWEKVEELALEIKEIGDKYNMVGYSTNGRIGLSKAFYHLGKTDKFYKTFIEYIDKQSPLLQHKQNYERKIYEQMLKEEELKRQQEISGLNKLLQKRGKIILGSFFVIFVLLSATIFFMWRSAQQRRKGIEKLRESNETKDKILSVISHDLRSPFAHLLTFLEFGDEGLSKEDKEQINHELYRSTQNGLFMLDNLLYWANSQSQEGRHLSKKLIVLKLSVESLINELSTFVNYKNIELRNNCEPIEVSTDEVLLHIILRNLITNAIKFSKENSTIEIFSEVTGQWLVIKVKDEGIGIPQEILSILNDQQSVKYSSRPGTSGEKGAGFGLKLSKEFAQMLGGKLTFKNYKECGAEAALKIPLV